jgi:hypothetical protein
MTRPSPSISSMPAIPSPPSNARPDPRESSRESDFVGLRRRDALLGALALFTSFGTLFCCALPVALVTLGAGAVMAGLVAAAPQIVVLSEFKTTIFAAAGMMLVIAAVAHRAARRAPCPADPALAASCLRLRRASSWLVAGAGIVYAIGFFFAFIAADLL